MNSTTFNKRVEELSGQYSARTLAHMVTALEAKQEGHLAQITDDAEELAKLERKVDSLEVRLEQARSEGDN